MGNIYAISYDGGGAHAVMTDRINAEIEKRLGKGIDECVHATAGTSAGATTAFTNCRINGQKFLSADKVLEHRLEDIPVLFKRNRFRDARTGDGWLSAKYDRAALGKRVAERVGAIKLSDIDQDGPKLIVPATVIEEPERYGKNKGIYIFKSWDAALNNFDSLHPNECPAQRDFHVADVLQATMSAPSYVGSHTCFNLAGEKYTFVDGGVHSNNPSLLMATELNRLFGGAHRIIDISIGSGQVDRPIPPNDGGKLFWAPLAPALMLKTEEEIADFALRHYPNVEHHRIQWDLKRQDGKPAPSDDMDDASPEQIELMLERAERVIEVNDRKLDRICSHLAHATLQPWEDLVAEANEWKAKNADQFEPVIDLS